MDSPFITLTLAIFLAISALIVQAQQYVSLPPPPPPPPPPSQFSPPPPPRPSRRHLSPPPQPNVGREHLSPPPKRENLNTGKKIGLLFIGVGLIMQVFVVVFLLITRRKRLKGQNVR